MNKTVLSAASCYSQKYYLDPEFNRLPDPVRKELKILCVSFAEKMHGIFSLGFYEDGSIFLEASGNEDDWDYDEIGAKLEIDRLKIEKKELLHSLYMYRQIFVCQEGVDEPCARSVHGSRKRSAT